ncbi:hypothetical protein TNCV_1558311 [Trichonephila clavipes]|uniref:Uncharacterized protein n=1 Tax=Trichonephila clavipes TaxID=2585209 RepID=A0A8X6UQR5_TRICX|nr:hypothetical protein TNCV_1558311 [Trichonephila clavipes]
MIFFWLATLAGGPLASDGKEQESLHLVHLTLPPKSHTPVLALHTTVAEKCPSSREDEQDKQGDSRDR